MAAAICGFHHLTGWPDRAPVGPFSDYTDYVAPRFTVPSVLAVTSSWPSGANAAPLTKSACRTVRKGRHELGLAQRVRFHACAS